jgi:hypothetical protein
LSPEHVSLYDNHSCGIFVTLCKSFRAIEVLINNAGIGMSSIRPDAEVRYPGIEELTPEIWDSFFAIFGS